MPDLPNGLFICIIALLIINHILIRQQIFAAYNCADENVLIRQINIALTKLILTIVLIYSFLVNLGDEWLILGVLYTGYKFIDDIFIWYRLKKERIEGGKNE